MNNGKDTGFSIKAAFMSKEVPFYAPESIFFYLYKLSNPLFKVLRIDSIYCYNFFFSSVVGIFYDMSYYLAYCGVYVVFIPF